MGKIKKENGITLVVLIITIIVMLILAGVTIQYGNGEIKKAKFEDLKATMLLIQGRAKIAIEKETFGEDYNKERYSKSNRNR